jgi:hypothetical protein
MFLLLLLLLFLFLPLLLFLFLFLPLFLPLPLPLPLLLLLLLLLLLKYLWHANHLIVIGLFITWEKWMSDVQIVVLYTGWLRGYLTLLTEIQNLACAVTREKLKFLNLMIHHQSFSIFSQPKMTGQRNSVIIYATITML